MREAVLAFPSDGCEGGYDWNVGHTTEAAMTQPTPHASEAPALHPPAKAKVTELLRSLSGELARLGVAEVWLFGSVARGDDHEGSDIDIAIRLATPFDFTTEFRVARLLRPHMGRHIDMALLPFDDRLEEMAGADLVRVI